MILVGNRKVVWEVGSGTAGWQLGCMGGTAPGGGWKISAMLSI